MDCPLPHCVLISPRSQCPPKPPPSEASAEEAVIGSLRSALEVYAMDQVVNNSSKSYPSNPFDALDNKSKEELLNGNWSYNSSMIFHYRNDGSTTSWLYEQDSMNPNYGGIMPMGNNG